MDLLQVAITVALSTVANQAGSPLIKAGYNQFSRKVIGLRSSQAARHLDLCNGNLKYRLLLLPVLLSDVGPIDLTDLSMIQLALGVQQHLQMLTAIRSSNNLSDMISPSEDITPYPSFNLSDSFSLSDSNLLLPTRGCSFQMCSCTEHKKRLCQ
ncbi:hypothetical protein [Leptothoe sp. PORK10 BA2]|uniref:hypothetical protein n=1 Tax=Leptothoe sp. PORK10 BA2 TaxID=3110254 RepID=UPI002B1F4824|nr:hypothetical protein [Leptothoe sp. PORK10 BA2]MEA5467034.1 hypothetical protein [Leptothoe sp. PORK10 BA2]